MSDTMAASYNPDNLSAWLEEDPYSMLLASASNTGTVIESLLAWGMRTVTPRSSDGAIVFDIQPPLTLDELFDNYVLVGRAVQKIVAIGYRYTNAHYDANIPHIEENFDFEITENFDAPAFVKKHLSLPPLSLLLSVSKKFLQYHNELDYFLRLLDKPAVKDRIYFGKSGKLSASGIVPALIKANYKIKLIGQMGIAYVNAKT